MIGWITPLILIDSAKSARSSAFHSVLGWYGLGWIERTGIISTSWPGSVPGRGLAAFSGTAVVSVVCGGAVIGPRRASRPLPRWGRFVFLVMV